MRRSGVSVGAFSTPTIIATLGPYTSASIRPTRHPSACIASARLTATVDLPTPPLPLATATICLTPAILRCCAIAGAAFGAVGAGCSSWTLTAGTPGIAATVALTSATIFSTTSGFADAIVSDTVTPAYATSISLMIPNETMSRVKPGYFTFLSSARISFGLGIVRIGPVAVSIRMRRRCQSARLMLSFPNRRKNDGPNARTRLKNSAHGRQLLGLAERWRAPRDVYAIVPAHPAQRRIFERYRELVQHLIGVTLRVKRLDR